MTETQIFQILGLFFFSAGLGALVNPKLIKNIITELDKSATLMFYGGIMSLAIGYFIVAFYNIWGWNSALIITVIGWMSLVKGLALLVFPTPALKFYKKMNLEKYNSLVSLVILALGVMALYFGYFV